MLSIRTQDRMALVPYKGRILISIKDGVVNFKQELARNTLVIVNEDNVYTQLGTYATKERALEVLDEIEKALRDDCVFSTSTGAVLIPTVYRMPKE